jgi:hypothetical protein
LFIASSNRPDIIRLIIKKRRSKMKKFVLVAVLVALVALAGVGVAYAQSPTQAPGAGNGYRAGQGARGPMNGDGILHDTMLAVYAERLGISVADLETRLDAGETMAQIALSTGLTVDEFRTLMLDARTQAIQQALEDGVLTQAQADWMLQRGAGQTNARMGNGVGMRGAGQGQYANLNCPYYTQANP